MIKIKVYNSKNEKQSALVRECVQFAIAKLMPKKKHLNINVRFVSMPEWGWCEQIFDDRNPKDFLILVKRGLNKRIVMETIFHEMTHVKQLARNELRLMDTKTLWHKQNHSETPYRNQPWEIEAYYYEKVLYEMFMSDK